MKEKTAAISTEACLLARIDLLEKELLADQKYTCLLEDFILEYCDGHRCDCCKDVRPDSDGTKYGFILFGLGDEVAYACSKECKKILQEEFDARLSKEQETLDELNEYLDSQGNHNR